MNTDIEKTREEIWKLAKLVVGSDEVGNEVTAVAMLLASAIVGPELRRVASLIGTPYRNIMWMGANARRNGIWFGDRVQMSEDWFDKKDGATALLCDSMCLLGILERTVA